MTSQTAQINHYKKNLISFDIRDEIYKLRVSDVRLYMRRSIFTPVKWVSYFVNSDLAQTRCDLTNPASQANTC